MFPNREHTSGCFQLKNPWEEIGLSDYENHMQSDEVMQLQALNEMMKDQLNRFPVKTIMVLGIAGGNGLEHINHYAIDTVFGIDVNQEYLDECRKRYSSLEESLQLIPIDLMNGYRMLPKADLVIANLLIEYIGYECFQHILRQVTPEYVSCCIQINTGVGFVSDSPYIRAFDRLKHIHHQIEERSLAGIVQDIGYRVIDNVEMALPNGKKLVRLDFMR